MEKDFTKKSIEYNNGFIDGLLWAYDNPNKNILSMAKEVLDANNKIIERMEIIDSHK